ncbi:MAG: ABC transporter ATP-binding protein, partial [Lachnospiraceae bacterium]
MSEGKKQSGMGHGPGGMLPGERAKNFKGTISQLMNYLGRYKIGVLIVMIFSIASTVFSITGPKILGKAITELFNGLVSKVSENGGINFDKVARILLILIGIYIISAVCSFIQGWLMTGIIQKICFKFREDISTKINRMPIKYFESRTVGEVLSRITNDVDTLGQGLNQSVTQLITSITMIIGILIMMLSISPIMTLIALVILPVSAILIGIVVKFSQKYFVAQQKYLGKINGQVEEVYSGHNIVKAFNKEEDMLKEFDETNGILFQSAWKSQFLSGMMQPV